MSNPWDDYTTASDESGPWDDYKKEDSLGDKSLGILEAGASMLAPLPSQIAGGVRGLSTLLSGQGLDKANEALESTMKSNFGFGAYEPSTSTGKRYAENLGHALNKPVEWAGDAGEFIGGSGGRLAGEVVAGTAMALVDPLVIGAGVKGMIGRAGKSVKKPIDVAALEQEMKTPVKKETAPWEDYTQGEMFPDAENVATPYNAGQAGVVEPITPKRQARQMELQMEDPPTVNVDAAGVSIPKGQERNVDLAKDQALADLDARARQDMLAQLPENHRRWAEGPAKTAELDALDEKLSFNRRTRKQGGGVLIGENEPKRLPLDVAWLAKDKDRFVEPSSTDLAALSKDVAENGVKKPITVTVHDGMGYITDGNNRLAAAKASGHEDIPYKVETTNVPFTAEQVGKSVPIEAMGIAPEQLVVRPKSKEALAAEDWLNNFNNKESPWVPKSQRGAIKIDWRDKDPLNHMKKIPGMDRRLKNLLPDQSTPEEFFTTHKNTPDIEQNLVQKGFNMLTKGGVYMTMKTDNPLIKRVVDRFLDADSNAKAATQLYVHEYMEPLARKLNDNEKADVWAAIKVAEGAKRPLTEDMMARYGFNEKQIEWAKSHQEVMGVMYEKLADSMRAAGIEPVSPMVAYAASRARGDFRRLIYNKEGSIIGILGANTRRGLEQDIKKYKQLNKYAVVGEERYFGGRGKDGTVEGFNQMLEFLSNNDPAIKDFVTKVNEQAQKDAFDYMNAKSHTMKKKGIFGMEGDKPFLNAVENAKEGMRAQVRYAETMIKWAEISEAVKDTKQFMSPANGLEMPNAKSYLNNYIDNALGHNPTELGRALEGLTAAFGKTTGLGTSIPARVMTDAKQLTNGLLLGLNPLFLTANMIQPFKAMPEMSAMLKSMGLSKSFDFGTGYSYIGKAAMDMMKEQHHGKLDPVITEALKYAKDKHVYASDLFETGGDISYTPRLIGNKITQAGAGQIEYVTRKAMYLAFTRMLHENGITPKQGLFEASKKLTDMSMNNYSSIEAPMGYSALGGAGRAAYNLMSYKHNELSRTAMFARDLPADKFGSPLLVNLAAQVAFAGIKGTILYAEANEIVKFITSKLGKPTSITKLLLDSDMSKFISHGMFAGVGADMSNRLGMQVFPGSVADAVMPGAGKLVDVAKAGATAIGSPNEYNVKNLIREMSPAAIAGPLDRTWFSPETADGEELALNRGKVEATAVRNKADKAWKSIGGTGLNESIQKTRSYENAQIEQAYINKRKSIVDNMAKEFFTKGAIPDKLAEKYVDYEGDPETLKREIRKIAEEQAIDAPTLQLLKLSASKSVGAAYKLQRRGVQ